jgi:NAD(P)-dependent dehydrogenase (short-subunit alcohol dehydrogenase family)
MGMLDGKVAIVTGGSQGLGLGIAHALAAEGTAVALAARTESKLISAAAEITERGGRALAVVCDVRERDQIAACIDTTTAHFGRLDIVVNNAQIQIISELLDVTDEQVMDAFGSGALATLRFMQLAHPHMKAVGGGTFINVGSGSQLMHGRDITRYGVYAGVKDMITALSRTAAMEFGGDNIRSLTISPAATSPALERYKQHAPDRYAESLARSPFGRYGDPEVDIGRAVAWLCSDDASYITGSMIMLDGGRYYLH